ncbi:unnamed protein product [Caenorhabditis bovis]|uniref:Uncharacterized protein n=1 Tax=Caenorhabditis bovis TaxID=2654633 RepID=A0A8S1ENP3_9PELO|nr:unnamed protein product [Caenorhabditis bovis]
MDGNSERPENNRNRANFHGQINLGSLFLHPGQGGQGFDFGVGQGANILGFGGDRSFKLAGNSAGVALGSNNGALIGGERVGVDGGLGAGREGLEMGSQVQFGNNPNPMHPAGQFGSFLENMKNFFAFLGNGMPMSPPPSPPFSIGSIGVSTLSPMVTTTTIITPWAKMDGDTSDEDGVEVIPPNNGDNLPTIGQSKSAELLGTDFSKDSDGDEFSEELFTAKTDRPRQLPGLIEFV